MRILHVLRSPVGGLFRHVRDLARGQAESGHQIGILCDASTGGSNADALLQQIKSQCSLGITRIPMSRLPGPGDISGVRKTAVLARALNVDVIHGHGAKGGLYARIAAKNIGKPGVYTPHGGSLHYQWQSISGPIFLGTEWLLRKTNASIVFVCNYERNLFEQKIGLGKCKSIVVHNGLWPNEFYKAAINKDASDLLFIGEMRMLKGVDILLSAIALLQKVRNTTATLVGDGPDLEKFKALAAQLNIMDQVKFMGARPIVEALPMGRIFVMPSRNESFPYVVLEAIAAHKPVLASAVGGIGEVLPKEMLGTPNNAEDLAARISACLANPKQTQKDADRLASELRHKFTAQDMANRITRFYQTLS